MCKEENMRDGTPMESVKSQRNFFQTAWIVITQITIEPALFLTMFTSVMYQLVVQNLYLEKSCRVEIGFEKSVCDAMTERNTSGYTQFQETEVQKMVSEMIALRTVIQGSFPLVVVIFAGSWSDRHNRRKPLVLLPIVGEILCCVFLLINSIFFYELPFIFTTLGDSIPFALLGGWSCLNNGIFSYVGAKYKDEEKTLRVGIMTACLMSGSLIGSSAGGFVYKMVGFVPFFSICIICFITAFLIVYIMLKDEEVKPCKRVKFCQDIFSFKYIIDTLKTGFKSGPNKRRYKITAIMLVFLFVGGPYIGELYMNYMYTRLKFSWDVSYFGVFSTAQMLIQVFGSVFSVVLFSRILHWDDTFLGIISVIGSCFSNVIFAFAPSGNYLFFAACCDLFQMTASIAVRSLMSKLVAANELGQTNSVLSLFEATLPMIFGPLYTTVYRKTVNTFPGTYFLVSVGIRIFGLTLFIWLYREALRERKRLKDQGKEGKELQCCSC
ncbi:hypothetical protein WA026_021362 [Henosepilachna vigintioctopunctata]|uniref:Solute carrier family 46 member 3 n=1 Tax=Henosepilachna vigintioctopunctata TaxID=420089 RepID=A0AAW1TXQ1_9CUCU